MRGRFLPDTGCARVAGDRRIRPGDRLRRCGRAQLRRATIDAVMRVKAVVFSGDQRIDNVWRRCIEGNPFPVGALERGDLLCREPTESAPLLNPRLADVADRGRETGSAAGRSRTPTGARQGRSAFTACWPAQACPVLCQCWRQRGRARCRTGCIGNGAIRSGGCAGSACPAMN